MSAAGAQFKLDPDQGVFRALVPLLPDIGVRAEAPGWRASYAMVPLSSDEGAVFEVKLTLSPLLRVSGRVRGLDGTPSRNFVVQAYTAINPSPEEFQLVWLHSGGKTTTQGPGRQLMARFRSRTTTAEDGTFSFDMREVGKTVLVIWEPGYAPVFHALGEVTASVQGLDLVLRPPEGRGSVRFLLDGKPMARQQLFLSDLTLRDIQPAQMIPVDSQGRVLAQWFGLGREYGLGFQGTMADGNGGLKDRFLLWNGQSEVELSTLPLATEVQSR